MVSEEQRMKIIEIIFGSGVRLFFICVVKTKEQKEVADIQESCIISPLGADPIVHKSNVFVKSYFFSSNKCKKRV